MAKVETVIGNVLQSGIGEVGVVDIPQRASSPF